jgi:hypothetical protein
MIFVPFEQVELLSEQARLLEAKRQLAITLTQLEVAKLRKRYDGDKI